MLNCVNVNVTKLSCWSKSWTLSPLTRYWELQSCILTTATVNCLTCTFLYCGCTFWGEWAWSQSQGMRSWAMAPSPPQQRRWQHVWTNILETSTAHPSLLQRPCPQVDTQVLWMPLCQCYYFDVNLNFTYYLISSAAHPTASHIPFTEIGDGNLSAPLCSHF